MAENKQEPKTFKWGDKEYLVDDLLKAHADQQNNFYEFAKVKGQYDDAALAGLHNAMDNRINAVREGKSFSADGILDGDVVDNTTIQTQKKGLFKKDKYVEQDNTEWAKYYLNKLVQNINPYEKEKTADKGTWDVSKHGFEAYLAGQGLNAQDVFENYDLRDANNPDAARSFAQRDAELRKHLGNYKTWLEGKGFDFTKNDNEWDDNFMTTLSDLINNQDWNDRTALSASLRKLGAGNGYTTAFTSDRWDLSKSKEELDAESKAAKEAEAAKIKQGHLDEFEQLAYDNRRASKPTYYKGYDGDFSMDWYGDLNQSQRNEWGTYLGRDNQAWGNAWVNLMSALKSGNVYSDKNAGILLQGTFQTQPHAFIDLGDGKYLIRDSVTDYGQGTVYDPNSGYTDTVFLGDIASNNSEIQNIYRQLAYKYANNKYGTKYEDRPDVLKNGGELIPKHQYGNAVAFNWESSNKDAVKAKAKENNLDPDIQKAKDRYIDSDNKSLDNPDAGFTGAEVARLVSIGADIGSMFLDPITGTAVGLGSTLTNFGADIADDGFQWEDVKNLGINVGFDLLGAIPIFGDAVGTGAKITRKLVKFAPRVMTALAAYQGVKNFGGMMDSWQKMMSGNEDAKMTVQDWRNIAQSISLITGGVRATRNKVAQNKMKKQAKVDGVVGVNVVNKANGEVKQILVDGETAKNIRAAQGDRAKVEAELSKLEQFKDSFGENGTFEVATRTGGLQKPWEKVTNADGSTSRELRSIFSEGIAQVNDVYDFSKVPQTGVSRGFRIPGISEPVNQWHQTIVKKLSGNPSQMDAKGAMTSKAIDDEIAKLRGGDSGVDATITKMKESMDARTKRIQEINAQLTPEKQRLKDLQQRLNGVSDVDALKARQTQIDQDITSIDSKIADRQKKIDEAQKALDKLLGKKRIPKKDRQAHDRAIAQARARLNGHTTILQGYANTKQQLTQEAQSITQNLQNHSDLITVQNSVNNLSKIKSQLSTSNHTHAYNRLQQLLTDLQANHSSIGGRNIQWDMSEILKNAGITNAFKQGGSINRNKINKYLKYAKG